MFQSLSASESRKEKRFREEIVHSLKVIIISTLIIVFMHSALASIVLGAYWYPALYYANFEVIIVNEDVSPSPNETSYGSVITEQLTSPSMNRISESFGHLPQEQGHNIIFNWIQLPPPVDIDELISEIGVWSVVYIPPDYSEQFQNSLFPTSEPEIPTQNLNHRISKPQHQVLKSSVAESKMVLPNQITTREQYPLIHLYYDEGRHYTMVRQVRNTILNDLSLISYNLSVELLEYYLRGEGFYQNIINDINMSMIAEPIRVVDRNIHGVAFPGLDVVSSYLFISIYITTQTTILLIFKIYSKVNRATVAIHPLLLASLRTIHAIYGTFFGSLVISLLVLIFGGRFELGFNAYWLFLWLVILSFYAIISFIVILFGKWGVVASYIFLNINISAGGGAIPIEMTPNFYAIGYALPFYHAISGSRTILFGSYNRLWMNVSVLLAYIVVFLVFTWVFGVIKFIAMRDRKKPVVKLPFESLRNSISSIFNLQSHPTERKI